jgi:hypothetical protein
MSIEITGIKEVQDNMKELANRIPVAIEKSLTQSVLSLQGKAQRLAPVDTGSLRGSATSGVEKEGNKTYGFVAFNEEYALEQHETLFYNHPKGGQAKYLEQPFNEDKDAYIEDLKNAIKEELK